MKPLVWAMQMMRDLADGKMPSGFDNGDAFSEMAAALGLPVDVEETQDAFVYTADVPGLEKGDLKARARFFQVASERARGACKWSVLCCADWGSPGVCSRCQVPLLCVSQGYVPVGVLSGSTSWLKRSLYKGNIQQR